MSTASDEPPAPPRLPRAVSTATAPPRAWPATHVARCALKRGDRRVYFASVEGEIWRYDALKDACDACWTSGRIVLALAHRGDVCLSLERHATEIYLAAYDCSRSRVVGRQRRVGTGSDGALSCTEGYVLVSVGRDVALYKNSEPCWRVRNLGDVLTVALSSRGAAVACRQGAWLIERASPKNARVLDSSTGNASIVATESVIVLARHQTLTLFSGDGSKRLHVFELGAPLSMASVALAFGRDGALLVLTSRSLEVRRDGSLVTSETAPPSTPQEQQHVLLRRLVKRVTIGVTDEFGSALLPSEDAGHHWPDSTHIDEFDEVGDDFSDEDHVDDVVALESVLDDVRRQRVKCRRAQTQPPERAQRCINQIVATRLHYGSIMTPTPSTRRQLTPHWLIYAQVRRSRGCGIAPCSRTIFDRAEATLYKRASRRSSGWNYKTCRTLLLYRRATRRPSEPFVTSAASLSKSFRSMTSPRLMMGACASCAASRREAISGTWWSRGSWAAATRRCTRCC